MVVARLLCASCAWSCIGLAACQASFDETVLVQNKLRRRQDPRAKIKSLPVRAKLSQEDLLRVTQHMRLPPINVNAHMKETKKLNSSDIPNLVESVASKLCNAHFGAGMTIEDTLASVATDYTVIPGIDRDVVRPWLFEGSWEIDADKSTLRYELEGSKSGHYRLVHPHLGCADVDLFPWTAFTGNASVPPDPPALTEDNWRVAFADASPLETAPVPLRDFLNINFIDKDTVAVVMHYKGKLYEVYNDTFEFNKDTKVLGYSMSKSVQGLLVGKFLDERGLDMNTTYSSMPALQKNKTAWSLTLRYLLNMAAGSPPKEDAVRALGPLAPDVAAFAAATQERAWNVTPGTFYYSTGYSFVVGRELRSLIGDDALYMQYPWSALFNPIGADSFMCGRDAAGNIMFGGACWATPRDWAKIGRLVLNHGVGPDGSQVLPKAWVDELWEGAGWHVNGFYNNGWYRLDRMCFDEFGPILMALGVGGQVTIIVKNRDLVIVRQSYSALGEPLWFLDFHDGCRGALQFLLENTE